MVRAANQAVVEATVLERVRRCSKDKSLKLLLVGGIPTPLKNMKVNWDDYPQYMQTYKMFHTTNQYCACETRDVKRKVEHHIAPSLSKGH